MPKIAEDMSNMEIVGSLMTAMLEESASLGAGLMGSLTKQRDDSQAEAALYCEYIHYVHECIELQAVPRPFGFWFQFIK
jgi:hypothetical protein